MDCDKKILVGNPASFAIESCIHEAYADTGLCALGYFVLHIQGRSFGVLEHDATLLGCAYGEIGRRLSYRGKHVVPFATEAKGAEIIDAIGEAVYDPNPKRNSFFGFSTDEVVEFISSSQCEWHRGYDEAFDDGSCILHFDVADQVRLLANKPPRNLLSWNHDPNTLVEIWLRGDDFYGVLEKWRGAFHRDWVSRRKI